MTMPNFLIIGAAKSGTTSLYSYLAQHPQVFMSPVKETNFFSFENEEVRFNGPNDMNQTYITDINDYQSLFSNVKDEIAIGEASPSYLRFPRAAHNIKKHLPKAKLIAILRNPVDAAYSRYRSYAIRRETITDFAKALEAEPVRIQEGWSKRWFYKQQGYYHTQIKPYFELFDKNQIKIYLYEDFIKNSKKVLVDIFRFLNVDESFSPNMIRRHNVTSTPKSLVLHHLISPTGKRSIRKNIQQILPGRVGNHILKTLENINKDSAPKPLSSELRLKLIDDYREEILQLEDLIDKDCSHWLKSS